MDLYNFWKWSDCSLRFRSAWFANDLLELDLVHPARLLHPEHPLERGFEQACLAFQLRKSD